MEISYIFSKESFSSIQETELFLYFRKQKPRKNSLYFRKRNFFIFHKTETLKKLLIFQEVVLRARKIKKTL